MRSFDKTVPFQSSTVRKCSAKVLQSTPCWESTSVEIVLKYYTITHFSQFKDGDMLTLSLSLCFQKFSLKKFILFKHAGGSFLLMYFIEIFPTYF